MTLDELRRLEQSDLIKLIDEGKLVYLDAVIKADRMTIESQTADGHILKDLCTIGRDGKADDEFGCAEQCGECGENCDVCPIQKAFNKLAAYEDTGFEPSELHGAILQKDITPNNPLIKDMMSDQGYCLVSNSYIQHCIDESKELSDLKVAKYKADKAKRDSFRMIYQNALFAWCLTQVQRGWHIK
ncbi:MAG: hypothetical protein Q4F95_07380 [Oscillospiraceae bacterium]|nr:hypothetical protein [Oscillospiraceae bacterium]